MLGNPANSVVENFMCHQFLGFWTQLRAGHGQFSHRCVSAGSSAVPKSQSTHGGMAQSWPCVWRLTAGFEVVKGPGDESFSLESLSRSFCYSYFVFSSYFLWLWCMMPRKACTGSCLGDFGAHACYPMLLSAQSSLFHRWQQEIHGHEQTNQKLKRSGPENIGFGVSDGIWSKEETLICLVSWKQRCSYTFNINKIENWKRERERESRHLDINCWTLKACRCSSLVTFLLPRPRWTCHQTAISSISKSLQSIVIWNSDDLCGTCFLVGNMHGPWLTFQRFVTHSEATDLRRSFPRFGRFACGIPQRRLGGREKSISALIQKHRTTTGNFCVVGIFPQIVG